MAFVQHKFLLFSFVIFVCLHSLVSSKGGHQPPIVETLTDRFPSLPISQGMNTLYGASNINISSNGSYVDIGLDNTTGSGLVSKNTYYHGFFSASIKLPKGISSGVVLAFYMSNSDVYPNNHDEIDFEFLGHEGGSYWTLQTNLYGNGSTRGREERIYPWFNPTHHFHQYSILWNSYHIVLLVDNIPVREIINNGAISSVYPLKPMSLYATIWDGSSWATKGGQYPTDYKYAPFVASLGELKIEGCVTENTGLPKDVVCSKNATLSEQQTVALNWLPIVEEITDRFPSMPITQGMDTLFGASNIQFNSNGSYVDISLDKSTGSGLVSKNAYYHGFFSASIKLPKGITSGVVLAFYEMELEFNFIICLVGRNVRWNWNSEMQNDRITLHLFLCRSGGGGRRWRRSAVSRGGGRRWVEAAVGRGRRSATVSGGSSQRGAQRSAAAGDGQQWVDAVGGGSKRSARWVDAVAAVARVGRCGSDRRRPATVSGGSMRSAVGRCGGGGGSKRWRRLAGVEAVGGSRRGGGGRRWVEAVVSNSQVFPNNHDELDFEFLGHESKSHWVLQTNLYANGSFRGREEKISLWFDPTHHFHQYSILWNHHHVVFFVDNIPIREVINSGVMSYTYPLKPMSLYATIWDGSSWATEGGKYHTIYKYAPFVASLEELKIEGCVIQNISMPITNDACSKNATISNLGPLEGEEYARLSRNQTIALNWVKRKHLFYSYCNDIKRRKYRECPVH
ncbi:hypothetical protein OSB04_021708 [Centaurea solstitialis]|uniref:GH16 domain-containing protein n=1 Tax=Centaurea solstitialis TaxID=347529 RepID=A0AA38SUP3_9ASTR|nr:hypothetical protein OSB04_021708 [Centaurea solstitialis]